ncbi:MAG: hypothetical protein H6807_14315 [Planctomycetes bacterium]|nr:hypothetical protein [Planctomycetota bacterium]
MSEQMPSGQPMMPEPTLVHDVTYEHIYRGQVYKQFYVFLWVSVAFFIGAILPWNGRFATQGFSLWQALMLVFSTGCIWNAFQCIKGRRLTLWPILAVEIIGVLLVMLHYKDVQSQTEILRYRNLAAVQKQIDEAPASMGASDRIEYTGQLTDAYKGVNEAYDDGVFGSHVALFGFGSTYINSDVVKRAKAEAQLGMFGMGYHLTWLALAFVGLFMVGSMVFAVVTAKPKEDPAEARRRARSTPKKGEDEATEADKD